MRPASEGGQTVSEDFQLVKSVVLKDGPRVKKTAKILTVMNQQTREPHHRALTIETGKKRQGSWELDDRHTISLSDEEDDEIGKLAAFLGEGKSPVEQLEALGRDIEGLRSLVRAAKANAAGFKAVEAAIAFGRCAAVVGQLQKLVNADAPETELRALIQANGWLLGNAHGQPVDSYSYEFGLWRNLDDSLEMVEVGPASGLLLRYESLPQSYYPGDELSRAIGRTLEHLDLVEMEGDKVRAKVVVGREGDDGHQEALKRFNAQLQRIEVLTYDQVLRMGSRVLDGLRVAAKGRAE
jgi:hypothetical protein